ncbi:MAG: SpoIIE family protein phosphatase, partial [Thermoleophilia bacterium]|nr:SpoIIE family protein phosphatase [Thermoleophilia bacterium]
MLSLSWKHAIERPSEELLAIIQRFADQAAIAWQSALQYEAQREAEKLRDALDRVLALAPTFHITGSREAVADAICEAAVETFGCSAAALYRVEGDRLCLLGRMPPLPGLQRGTTFPLRPEMPLARELRSRAPVFIPDVTAPDRFPHPLPAKVIAQAKTRSALYLPLRPGPRGPRNLLVLTWNQAREQPDKDFLAVFQRFADQVALALTNASAERLHARLEASLLPALLPVHPRFQVFTRYRTGEQRLRLGGDFVGTVVSDDGWLHFTIGDVSGHGPDAAALGANLRSTWRALVLAGTSLQKTLEIMHRILMAERSEANIFVTLLAGRLSPQGDELALVNVGHPPPLLATGRVTALAATPVPPLGFANCERWPVRRFRLPEHWSLLCYTDGLIDARVEPESAQRFGEERLREHLAAHLSGLQSPDAGREAAAAAQAGGPPSAA